MRVEIIEPIDELNRRVWVWYVSASAIDITITLDEYRQESRPTTRHKFKSDADGAYHRLTGHRDWAQMRGEMVPPTPLHVLTQLRDEVNRRTRVVRP